MSAQVLYNKAGKQHKQTAASCKTTQKQAPRGSKGRETHGKNQIDAAETDGCEGQTAGRGNGA